MFDILQRLKVYRKQDSSDANCQVEGLSVGMNTGLLQEDEWRIRGVAVAHLSVALVQDGDAGRHRRRRGGAAHVLTVDLEISVTLSDSSSLELRNKSLVSFEGAEHQFSTDAWFKKKW